MPAIDLIEVANLQYKEDMENLSPLHDTMGAKILQISYSSIAVVCNSSKTTVMNCLKEVYSTMLYLAKQGNEISLDLKIGTLNIMRDSKLMFRNYNPDVKLDRKRNQSVGTAASQRSGVPTSVATPLTNFSSTLSYRGQSQDVPARHVFNHVGIKRSGPTYQHNADLNKKEGEKLFYRHKKDPYSHLDSFIQDERFEIESKIQQLRLQERQRILNAKKKQRRGMSNSFHNINELSTKHIALNNSSFDAPKITHQRQNTMGGTGLISLDKSGDLDENAPSSVNDKIPSKFVIDYPNFLRPAKYHPYRRLEEVHIADVLQEARKRHEEKLMKTQEEDHKYTDMFFKTVEENKTKMNNIEENRKRLYEEHKRCLQEQILHKRLKTAMENQERRRYVKTHFGPEESEVRSKMHVDKGLQEKDYLRNALLSQIKEKRDDFVNRSKKERAEDQKALEIISQIR